MKTIAIVVAAGGGERMSASAKATVDYPPKPWRRRIRRNRAIKEDFQLRKPFMSLAGRPIISYPLEALSNSKLIDGIILVLKHKKELKFLSGHNLTDTEVVEGGATRCNSVYKGLKRLEKKAADFVLIHDGVRPFVTEPLIRRIIQAAEATGAAIAAVPVKSTIKQLSSARIVESTLPRAKLWEVQTPQVFDKELILKAHNQARRKGLNATDDAVLVEGLGVKVRAVMGSYENIKITTPEDLLFAEALIRKRSRG